MAIDNEGERGGQVRERINGIELAGFYQRGDGRLVLRPRAVSGEESILAIEGNYMFILPMSGRW